MCDIRLLFVSGGADRGKYPAALVTKSPCVTQCSGNTLPRCSFYQFTGGSLRLGAIETFHPARHGEAWVPTGAANIGVWSLASLARTAPHQDRQAHAPRWPQASAGSRVMSKAHAVPLTPCPLTLTLGAFAHPRPGAAPARAACGPNVPERGSQAWRSRRRGPKRRLWGQVGWHKNPAEGG